MDDILKVLKEQNEVIGEQGELIEKLGTIVNSHADVIESIASSFAKTKGVFEKLQEQILILQWQASMNSTIIADLMKTVGISDETAREIERMQKEYPNGEERDEDKTIRKKKAKKEEK